MGFHHDYIILKHHRNVLIKMDKKVENLIMGTIIIPKTRVHCVCEVLYIMNMPRCGSVTSTTQQISGEMYHTATVLS